MTHSLQNIPLDDRPSVLKITKCADTILEGIVAMWASDQRYVHNWQGGGLVRVDEILDWEPLNLIPTRLVDSLEEASDKVTDLGESPHEVATACEAGEDLLNGILYRKRTPRKQETL